MVVGHTAVAQQQWKQVAPAGAGFRIEFPASPKTEWKDLPSEFGTTRTLVSLLSRDDGLDFLMMYSKFPAGSFARDPQIELEALRNIQAVQGKLLSEAVLTVSGAPARRFVISFHGGDTIATTLLVLNGTRLYQAICVVPRSRENDPDISRFVDSLALVPL